MSNALPTGWAMPRLDEIASLNPRHSKDLDPELAVTFVPMPAVSECSPLLDASQERALKSVRTGFTHFAEGDVLFAKITPCMENGKGAVATSLRNGLGCGTTELHVVRLHGGIHPHYLYRYLAQRSVRRAAKENFTGSAGQARVPVGFIRELEIPLPPLSEQQRIVAKLEALLSKVDTCQRRLAKIPPLLKRFRQSVLAAACSGRLTSDWRKIHPEIESVAGPLSKTEVFRKRSVAQGNQRAGFNQFRYKPAAHLDLGNRTKGIDELFELPANWQWTSLGQLTWSIADGPHFSPKYVEQKDGVPFISGRNISYKGIDLSDAKYVSHDDHRAFSRRAQPMVGDVLLTKGGTTGIATLVSQHVEFSIWVHVALLKVVPELATSAFLRDALSSPVVYLQSQAQTHGVGNQDLGLTRMVHMALPLPPLPEQHEIVRRVEQLFTLADQLEARFAKAQAYVDKLTQSLLAKAFRGELVPQDPNDEPVSALLERIRVETRAIKKPPRKKAKATA